jgi:hypothetical protein
MKIDPCAKFGRGQVRHSDSRETEVLQYVTGGIRYMRVAAQQGKGRMAIEERPTPKPGEGQVLKFIISPMESASRKEP